MTTRPIRFITVLLLLFALAACGQPTTGVTPTPPITGLPGDTPSAPTQGTDTTAAPVASPSTQAEATETTTVEPAASPETTTVTAPTTSPEGTATTGAVATAAPAPGDTGYLDDRSTPQSLISSLFNAINKRQYLRAYSYWDDSDPTAAQPGPFDAFAAGYENTESVLVTFGTNGATIGAGQYFATVPVYVASSQSDGSVQNYAGCYVTHLSSPDAQATPPFQPLEIRVGNLEEVGSDVDPATLLGSACERLNSQYGTSPAPAPVTPVPNDISAQRYLDDRSNGTQLMRSFFNALNSHQYLRAYSYWEDQSGTTNPPGTFDTFESGYADLQTVDITIGEITGDAGAGQFYQSVPITSVATTATGETQTFVGCYVLHLSSPDAQATPPFRSWSIQSATVEQVENNTDTGAMLATVCAQ